ncbi:MAG: CBS domain-containing protein [Fervidobacterium sp.]
MLPKKNDLIEQFKELMKQTGVSQEEVAEKTGISQPVISRILNDERELRYDEAKKILDFLQSCRSSIPSNMLASDIATKEDELFKVEYNEKLSEVAKRMFEKGYSQAPVYKGDNVIGVITEKSFIKLLLEPKRKLEELTVEDAQLEDPPEYSHDTSLQDIAHSLLDYYAVLVKEGGKVVGIITRADFLKLFSKNSLEEKT